MANYSDDAEVLKVRPDCYDAGVAAFPNQHLEATRVINRAIDVGWYRAMAELFGIDPQSDPFTQSLLLNADTQLTALGTFKAVELIALFLSKMNKDEEKWERMRARYKEMYEAELAEVLGAGLDYDWDEDGTIDDDERAVNSPRFLVRA
ncbi:MAG: hypothetical protein GY851_35720 [bacterium]|nr:hypothetical protein [bacterium]